MVRRDKRSDIKLGIPFLNPDGIPEIPIGSIKVEIFTTETKKITVSVLYDSVTENRIYSGCFFRDIQYSNIEGLKPILVIPIDKPNFSPGRLQCTITVTKPDEDFSDSKQTVVRTVQTKIQVI